MSRNTNDKENGPTKSSPRNNLGLSQQIQHRWKTEMGGIVDECRSQYIPNLEAWLILCSRKQLRSKRECLNHINFFSSSQRSLERALSWNVASNEVSFKQLPLLSDLSDSGQTAQWWQTHKCKFPAPYLVYFLSDQHQHIDSYGHT